MVKKIGKILGGLLALVLLVAGGVLGYAHWYTTSKTFDAAYPDVHAASSPEAIARGEEIFTAMCGDCHLDRKTGLATGRWMDDVPAFLGVFNTANITSDGEFGIGSRSDKEIARVIRTGVRFEGTENYVMPVFGFSDEDLAAVLGYLRSGAAPLRANKAHLPRSKPSVIPGSLILTFVAQPQPEKGALKITAPEKKVSVEYGKYAADGVYQCWDCHTEGFDAAKHDRPDVYGGGFELADGLGRQVFSPNITNSPEGIGGWTYEQFARAMREGVRPDGYMVRAPMPRWRSLDDVEMQSIYTYLQTVPPSHKKNKPGTAPMVKAPPPETKPEQLFISLGCVTCHAKGAPYHEKIKQCLGKPVDEVAAWIRNPEKTKPHTQMPTFADLITVEQATALAAWVQEHPAKE